MGVKLLQDRVNHTRANFSPKMEWFCTFSFYSFLFFELNLQLESKRGFGSTDEFHWQTGQFGRSCLAIGKCPYIFPDFLVTTQLSN